jgi:hypothetical protein
VKDPALALLVGASRWGKSPRCVEDDDVVPLAPFDAMHRGQQHRGPVGGGPGEHVSQPGFEGGDVGMEGGHRFQRGQVVGVGRAIGLAARGVEDVHGVAQPDLDPDGLEGGRADEVAGLGPRSRGRGVDLEFRDVAAREAAGQSSDVVIEVVGRLVSMSTTLGAMPRDGRRIVSMDVLPPDGLGQIRCAGRRRRCGCRCAAARRATRGVVHGTPASMQATCTGRRAELTRARTAMSPGSTPPSARPRWCRRRGRRARRPGLQHRDRAGALQWLVEAGELGQIIGTADGSVDLLVQTALVVGEHVARRVDEAGRAPVVDRQGVAAGTGEVAGKSMRNSGVAPE